MSLQTRTIESTETLEQPPQEDEGIPPSKVYAPLSFHVLALMIPASIFGVLARLGLTALATYDGRSIFPLAYSQVVGCLAMGAALRLKLPLGTLYVQLNLCVKNGTSNGKIVMPPYTRL